MNKKERSLYDQYFEIKNKYKDCIVAFQLGNFHQLYYYDAFLVSEELGLKKSVRSLGGGHYTLMCGVPSNKIQLRADVLALKGYKTVICNAIVDENSGIRVRKVSVINEPKGDKIDISAKWEEYFTNNCEKTQDEIKGQYNIQIVDKKPKVKATEKSKVYKEFEIVDEVLKELKHLEIHNLTMKTAFDLLVEWKEKYEGTI